MRLVRRLPWILLLLHTAVAGIIVYDFFLPSSDANHALVLVLLFGADPILLPLLAVRAFAGGGLAVWLAAVAVLGSLQWWGLGWLLRWSLEALNRAGAGREGKNPPPDRRGEGARPAP
jgi:hypothetical protein